MVALKRFYKIRNKTAAMDSFFSEVAEAQSTIVL